MRTIVSAPFAVGATPEGEAEASVQPLRDRPDVLGRTEGFAELIKGELDGGFDQLLCRADPLLGLHPGALQSLHRQPDAALVGGRREAGTGDDPRWQQEPARCVGEDAGPGELSEDLRPGLGRPRVSRAFLRVFQRLEDTLHDAQVALHLGAAGEVDGRADASDEALAHGALLQLEPLGFAEALGSEQLPDFGQGVGRRPIPNLASDGEREQLATHRRALVEEISRPERGVEAELIRDLPTHGRLD
jgi:hypothetical protein